MPAGVAGPGIATRTGPAFAANAFYSCTSNHPSPALERRAAHRSPAVRCPTCNALAADSDSSLTVAA